MRTTFLFIIALLYQHNVFSQEEFNESVMKEVQALIINKEHDKADSILDIYQRHPQGVDASFLLDLTRSLNGYSKIQIVQNVSLMVPYAESGKRAFMYIKNNINENNALQSDFWPIITAYAELFNYMNDSIIDEIAYFSTIYYEKFGQKNLYSYYTVAQNTYQYHISRNEWKLAAESMKEYNRIAVEEKDSSVRIPLSSTYIGSAYLRDNNFKEAEKWLSDSYKRFSKFEERKKFRDYCELLINLAYLHLLQGNIKIAYEYALESCMTSMNNYGKNSSAYVNSLGILSDTELGLNKTNQGIVHLEEVVGLLDSIPQMREEEKQNYRDKLKYVYMRLNIKKDIQVNNSVITDNSIILEATDDFAKGRMENAILRFKNLLDYYDNHFNTAHISNYIFVASSLSNVLVSIGYYSEADNILNRAIEKLTNNKVNTNRIRVLYESKGLLYFTIKNIDMALYWYNKSKDLYNESEEKGLGYGLLLSNLGACQIAKGEYSLGKHYSDKAYEICLKYYGDNSNDANDRLVILGNIAAIYTKLKEYSKGKELYERIINEATSPQNNGTKALALITLSEIYLLSENNFPKAEKYIHEAMKMETSSYVKDMAEIVFLFSQIMQKRETAVNAIERYNNNIKDELANIYMNFSEVEREEYWTQKSRSMTFFSNLSAITFNSPKSLKMAYDNTIYTKTMSINSGRLLGQMVNNCIPNTQKDYSKMIDMKRKLSDKNCPNDSIDVYREIISKKEKAIIASIPDLGSKLTDQIKTSSDVQRMLGDNDIAIEFIFLPHIKTPFDDSELSYGAMLLAKNDTLPKLIPLCSEYDLEDLLDTYTPMGQNEIDSLYAFSNQILYHMIWDKLAPYIPVGSTIYYSPTGYINKINLSAISNGNKRLSEIYDFHEVSTTALIDEVKQSDRIDCHNAALFGDINYSEDVKIMAESAKKFSSYTPGEVLLTRSLNRGTWDLLPGTKEEVLTISELLRNKGTNVYTYSQNDANEESFKALDANAPALIHIATHGFYFPSKKDVTTSFFNGLHSYTQKDYSMLYSGLLFAGCNNTWAGKDIIKGVEDGILTADEISHLDLSGNKLIVLSACNTGLGDIDNVDGVFGLQRGLKRAGVKTIMMSLWKVPDEETQELMGLFYKELLLGKTIHQSLKSAQYKLMNMGKSPYYWAGFILLD